MDPSGKRYLIPICSFALRKKHEKTIQFCILYGGYGKYMKILGAILNTILVGGIPTPLKNDGVRQLG